MFILSSDGDQRKKFDFAFAFAQHKWALQCSRFILRQAQLSLCSGLLELLLFSLDAPRTRSVTANSHANTVITTKILPFFEKNMFNYTEYCLRITGTGCNLDLKSWIKFDSRETFLRILLQHQRINFHTDPSLYPKLLMCWDQSMDFMWRQLCPNLSGLRGEDQLESENLSKPEFREF